MPLAIDYLDKEGKLRLGGGMSADQISAMLDGALRAKEQLELAATLNLSGSGSPTVKIVNHTGHKLISGYPEGRRMWLNIKWKDSSGNLVREDGAYGNLELEMDLDANGENDTVKTLLELEGEHTKIYEVHMGMTQEWAAQLVGLGYPEDLALSYDRVTGLPDFDLGQLAGAVPGASHETFHFVLNNRVVADNRIPPYGMSYEVARTRNALPEPVGQYGNPGPDGTYDYWDEIPLNKPSGATYAEINLMYQPTSWEYIQFLYLANKGTDPAQGGNAFLGEEGKNILDAWLHTGMAEPHVMASTTWGAAPGACIATPPELLGVTAGNNAEILIDWQAAENALGYALYYDQSDKAQLIPTECEQDPTCISHTDQGLTNGQEYCYKVTSRTETCESAFSNILCSTASQPGLTTRVPDLIGKTQTVAEQLIIDAGLAFAQSVGTSYSDILAEGLVISQSPASGTEVQQDSQVSVVVSLGPTPSLVCSTIVNKSACNKESTCKWEGKGKNGSCIDIAP